MQPWPLSLIALSGPVRVAGGSRKETNSEETDWPLDPDESPRLRGGLLEAAIGFEPMHRGFADLSLTTWVRRPVKARRLEAALTIMPARTHQLKRNDRSYRTGFSAGLRAAEVGGATLLWPFGV